MKVDGLIWFNFSITLSPVTYYSMNRQKSKTHILPQPLLTGVQTERWKESSWRLITLQWGELSWEVGGKNSEPGTMKGT